MSWSWCFFWMIWNLPKRKFSSCLSTSMLSTEDFQKKLRSYGMHSTWFFVLLPTASHKLFWVAIPRWPQRSPLMFPKAPLVRTFSSHLLMEITSSLEKVIISPRRKLPFTSWWERTFHFKQINHVVSHRGLATFYQSDLSKRISRVSSKLLEISLNWQLTCESFITPMKGYFPCSWYTCPH